MVMATFIVKPYMFMVVTQKQNLYLLKLLFKVSFFFFQNHSLSNAYRLSCAEEHKASGMLGPISLQSKYLEFNSSSGAQELTYQLPWAAQSACGYQANKVLMYRKQSE